MAYLSIERLAFHVLSLRLPGRGVRVTRCEIHHEQRPTSVFTQGPKLHRGCDGVSGQTLREDAWHQEGGHGHCQAHHLERIQYIGGHKRGPDLITNLQHPRSIHVHARTRHCQKLHVKSESQRKPERHSRKEKPNQDWPESVSENKLVPRSGKWLFRLQQTTSKEAAALNAILLTHLAVLGILVARMS